jgi:hypothetical protein
LNTKALNKRSGQMDLRTAWSTGQSIALPATSHGAVVGPYLMAKGGGHPSPVNFFQPMRELARLGPASFYK